MFQGQFQFETLVVKKLKEKDILVSTYNKGYVKLKNKEKENTFKER